MTTYRITAPHFVAGLVVDEGYVTQSAPSSDGRSTKTSPSSATTARSAAGLLSHWRKSPTHAGSSTKAERTRSSGALTPSHALASTRTRSEGPPLRRAAGDTQEAVMSPSDPAYQLYVTTALDRIIEETRWARHFPDQCMVRIRFICNLVKLASLCRSSRGLPRTDCRDRPNLFPTQPSNRRIALIGEAPGADESVLATLRRRLGSVPRGLVVEGGHHAGTVLPRQHLATASS